MSIRVEGLLSFSFFHSLENKLSSLLSFQDSVSCRHLIGGKRERKQREREREKNAREIDYR